MRTEGAGKGDALRQGVDWKKYGDNYDAIFGKKKRRESRATRAFRELINSGPPSALRFLQFRAKHGDKFKFPSGMGDVK